MGRQPSSLVVLGDHLVDDRGQARHLIECEADADPSEIVCRIPVVEAPAGGGTHLVVELGPDCRWQLPERAGLGLERKAS